MGDDKYEALQYYDQEWALRWLKYLREQHRYSQTQEFEVRAKNLFYLDITEKWVLDRLWEGL